MALPKYIIVQTSARRKQIAHLAEFTDGAFAGEPIYVLEDRKFHYFQSAVDELEIRGWQRGEAMAGREESERGGD